MNKLNSYLHKKRAEYIIDKVLPLINKNEKVLDIGSGSGHIGDKISKKANVQLLDIDNFNSTKLPLRIYDGKKIPFKDKSFDVGLILGVLHHCENQEEVIEEAKRVCKRLIIIENIFMNQIQRLVLCFFDSMFNLPAGIKVPFTFRRDGEWRQLFSEVGLKISEEDEFRSTMLIFKNKLYVLEE